MDVVWLSEAGEGRTKENKRQEEEGKARRDGSVETNQAQKHKPSKFASRRASGAVDRGILKIHFVRT